MALPSKKRTKSSKKRRAAHFALSKASLSTCPKCKKPVLPHHVCKSCGYYKGQDILLLDVKAERKKKKEKKKEQKAKGK